MNKQSVTDIVDQSPLGGLQIMTLLLCFIVLMINGLDASAMGYIAPELAQEWGIDRAELGPAFAAGLLGMLLGSFICGPAADRYGRKTVLLICSVIVALGTLGYAFSSSISVLVALRLLTGMGLGGVLPGCITLVSEYSPIRWRMLLVTLSFSGFTLGMALGGWVADLLLPVLGWRGLLFVGSIAPLVMLPVLYFMLPESICFLANRPQQRAKLLRIVERIGGHRKWQDVIFTDGMDRKPGEKNLQLSPVAALFSEGRTERTLLLWLTFLCCLFSFYLLSNWLPTVLRSSGFDARMALYVAAGGHDRWHHHSTSHRSNRYRQNTSSFSLIGLGRAAGYRQPARQFYPFIGLRFFRGFYPHGSIEQHQYFERWPISHHGTCDRSVMGDRRGSCGFHHGGLSWLLAVYRGW